MISFVFCSTIVFAEDFTITTYYPSPYGSYNQLTAQSMKIGAAYSASGVSFVSDGLIVGGNVGIGTPTPLSKLDINGGVAIGTYAGANAAPNNGLIVSGDVGIGIVSPTAKLHVNGNIKAILNDIDGALPANMRYNSGTNEIGYDVAELFEANQEVEPGDVLSIDDNGKLKKSSLAYDSKVAGVVSEAPAVLFEGSQLQIAPQPFEFKKGNKPPLALAGKVRCKATNQGGKIKAGDLLVTSSMPGYAMRGEPDKIRFGTVLGKALGPLNEKEGVILVLVTL